MGHWRKTRGFTSDLLTENVGDLSVVRRVLGHQMNEVGPYESDALAGQLDVRAQVDGYQVRIPSGTHSTFTSLPECCLAQFSQPSLSYPETGPKA